MASRVKYTGDQYIRRFEKHIEGNLDRAALLLVGDIVNKFGGSGMGSQMRGATKGARRRNRSKPGQRPHVQSGRLKSSYTFERQKGLRFVGSSLRPQPGQAASYALYQELGTKKMAARPHQRASLVERRRDIASELTRPFKG